MVAAGLSLKEFVFIGELAAQQNSGFKAALVETYRDDLLHMHASSIAAAGEEILVVCH